MNFKERTQQIETEFSRFDDWNDKYQYLIELGWSLPLIDEKYKQPQYLIEGCQSRVWLFAEFREGKIYYTADSDSSLTKGIASLIIRSFNGLTPDEIISADLSDLNRIGLKEHLTPTRSNGLVSMIKQIQLYAMAFKIKRGV
jgi:cysteine desulfuration protein SufE